MSSLELRRKDIGKRRPASQRSEVVALVIVGAAGGGQESPIFEFLPFAWLSQVEITPEATAAVSEREGGRARVRMASMALVTRDSRRGRHFGFPFSSSTCKL